MAKEIREEIVRFLCIECGKKCQMQRTGPCESPKSCPVDYWWNNARWVRVTTEYK